MKQFTGSELSNKPVIAIDGYSSCGKSTLAKAVAEKLGLLYIDSGAMYRAVTLYFIQNNLEIPGREYNAGQMKKLLDDIHIQFEMNHNTGLFEIYLNDHNVEKQIRQMNVSELVSNVSAIREVRERMVSIQQKLGKNGGIVMDGRDIGTAVFPDADLKIFMTADPLIRAQRRFDELKSTSTVVSFEEVFKNLQLRDKTDTSRSINPLRKAQDAVILDNSNLNRDQQLDFVLNEIEKLSTIS